MVDDVTHSLQPCHSEGSNVRAVLCDGYVVFTLLCVAHTRLWDQDHGRMAITAGEPVGWSTLTRPTTPT